MKKISRILSPVFCLWFIGKCIGSVLMITGPWGPAVRGDLPTGGHVIFQSRSVGGETDDQLVWINNKGITQSFWVDQIHAGFGYVVLKLSEDGTGVWVEADGKVSASLNLNTGDFRPEQSVQLPFATYGKGQKIGEGRTWSILQILLPF